MNTTTLPFNDDKFTDETLSAFLDGELPPATMDAVRAALATDAVLAARLTTLTRVNALVQLQAQSIDATPMPAAIVALLTDTPADTTDAKPAATVVQGPWRGRRQQVLATLALAASLLVAAAIGLRYSDDDTALPALADYSDVLTTTPSGTEAGVGTATLLSRFSFRNRSDQYCRQYQLANANSRSENIACRDSNGWTLVASVALPLQPADTLQPASAPAGLDPLLDSILDAEMQGPVLDAATEQTLIDGDWQQ